MKFARWMITLSYFEGWRRVCESVLADNYYFIFLSGWNNCVFPNPLCLSSLISNDIVFINDNDMSWIYSLDLTHC